MDDVGRTVDSHCFGSEEERVDGAPSGSDVRPGWVSLNLAEVAAVTAEPRNSASTCMWGEGARADGAESA